MTMTAYRVKEATTASTSVRVHPGATVMSHPDHEYARPAAVLASQLYYWTEEWQNGEAEALAEIERGEGRVFNSGREAVDWLHSLDD